mmetsp:Transcript_60530/g.161803  ORF Transcript_60530/g.161803 Transcript_60530/m.161803 type:complete len:499 (-) Transcript_60530:853-2349(-)
MACARVTLQAKPTPAPWPRQAWQFACLSLALARWPRRPWASAGSGEPSHDTAAAPGLPARHLLGVRDGLVVLLLLVLQPALRLDPRLFGLVGGGCQLGPGLLALVGLASQRDVGLADLVLELPQPLPQGVCLADQGLLPALQHPRVALALEQLALAISERSGDGDALLLQLAPGLCDHPQVLRALSLLLRLQGRALALELSADLLDPPPVLLLRPLVLALEGPPLHFELLGVLLRLGPRLYQLILQPLPLHAASLARHRRAALGRQPLRLRARGAGLELLHLRAQRGLAVRRGAVPGLEPVLAHARGLDVCQSLPQLGAGVLQLRLRGLRLLLHADGRLLLLVDAGAGLGELRPHRVQLGAGGALLLRGTLPEGNRVALQAPLPLRRCHHRAMRLRHPPRGRLHGGTPGARQGHRGHPVHGGPQLPADVGDGLGVGVAVGVEPLLPGPQGVHELLVGKPRVPHAHQSLLAGQCLLELLPVLATHALFAHRALVPLRLE